MNLGSVTLKKSYLERFRQRVRGKSPEEVSIRRIMESPSQKMKRGILKAKRGTRKAKPSQTDQEELAWVQVSKEKIPDDIINNRTKDPLPDSNATASLKKQILESIIVGPHSFKGMVQDYAKAINLTEMERQCLGFEDDGEELDRSREAISPKSKWANTDVNNNRVLNPDRNHSPKPTCKKNVEQAKDHPKNPPENNASAWHKLSDAFSLKTWLGLESTTNEAEKANRQNEDNVDTKLNPDQPVPISSNMEPHEILRSKLLSLIETACTDEHDNDTAKNCFKCQHKDGFRSLILNFIDEIHYIWKNNYLSSRRKNKKILEVFEVWTYQLSEQNLSLAEAYSASSRAVDKLKGVLLHSRTSLKRHQKTMDKEKSKNDALSYEISLRDQNISKLKAQLEYESERRSEISKKLEENQSDVNSLTQLIIRLRDKGVWDVHGLPMGNETFQKIFHSDYYLHGSKVVGSKEFSQKRKEWRNEIELLKSESDTLRQIIAAKDKEIQRIHNVAAAAARKSNRIE